MKYANGLGVKAAFTAIKESFRFMKKSTLSFAVPAIFDLLSVFTYFMILWFIFAPRINNALVDIMDSGQIAKDSADVSAIIQFEGHVNSLVKLLLVFLFVLYVLWCLLQGYSWFRSGSAIAKNHQGGYWNFFLRFSAITFIYLVPIMIITSLGARMSFGYLPAGQLGILGITVFLDVLLLLFLLISYGCLIHQKSAKTFLMDLLYCLKNGLYLGVRYILGFIVLDLFSILLLIVIDIILRIIGLIHVIVYLVIAFFLVFAVFGFLRFTVIRYIGLLHNQK